MKKQPLECRGVFEIVAGSTPHPTCRCASLGQWVAPGEHTSAPEHAPSPSSLPFSPLHLPMVPVPLLLLWLSLALGTRVALWAHVPGETSLEGSWCDPQTHTWCTVTKEEQFDEVIKFLDAYGYKDIFKSSHLVPSAHKYQLPKDVLAELKELKVDDSVNFFDANARISSTLKEWRDPSVRYIPPFSVPLYELLTDFHGSTSSDNVDAVVFVPLILVPGSGELSSDVFVTKMDGNLGFLQGAVDEYWDMLEENVRNQVSRMEPGVFYQVENINGMDPMEYLLSLPSDGKTEGNVLSQEFITSLGGTFFDTSRSSFPETSSGNFCITMGGVDGEICLPWAVTLKDKGLNTYLWYESLVSGTIKRYDNFPSSNGLSTYKKTKSLNKEDFPSGAMSCALFEATEDTPQESPKNVNYIRFYSFDSTYLDLAPDLSRCISILKRPDRGVDNYNDHSYVETGTIFDVRGVKGGNEVTLLFLLDFISSGRISPTGDLILRHRDGYWEYTEFISELGMGLTIDPLSREREFIPSKSESNGLVTELSSAEHTGRAGDGKLADRFSRYFRFGEFKLSDWELNIGTSFPLIGGRSQTSPYDGLLSSENALVLTDGNCVGTCHRFIRRVTAMGYARAVDVVPWGSQRKTDMGMGSGSIEILRSLTQCGGKVTTNCTTPLLKGSDVSVSPVLVMSLASRDNMLLTEYASSTHGGELLYTPSPLHVPSTELLLGVDLDVSPPLDSISQLFVTSRSGVVVNAGPGYVMLGCHFDAKSSIRYGQIYDPSRKSLDEECIVFDCGDGMSVIDGKCSQSVLDGNGDTVSTGAFVGVIVAVIVVAGGLSALAVWLLGKRKDKNYLDPQADLALAALAVTQ